MRGLYRQQHASEHFLDTLLVYNILLLRFRALCARGTLYPRRARQDMGADLRRIRICKQIYTPSCERHNFADYDYSPDYHPCSAWGFALTTKAEAEGASQMVAVYDVVEIAGISYDMISKTPAHDLNRNHTM